MTNQLRITEIFHSLQGESTTTGLPTAFIRLTGCPLRCTYCDTAYAFSGGKWISFDAILETIQPYQADYVTITGGEPLAQPNVFPLMTLLCDQGYRVSLETSGALDISRVDPRVMIVMDLKTPASGEVDKNRFENLDFLKSSDQIKFVISDEADYLWSKQQLVEHSLDKRCHILFSPAYQTLAPAVLAEWILADKLPVRFQIQLHKFLWGDKPGV